MRVLFLALLLVNVAFFGWEYRHPEPPPAPVAEVDPGVPPIRLIRERAAAGKPATAPQAGSARQVPQPAAPSGAGPAVPGFRPSPATASP